MASVKLTKTEKYMLRCDFCATLFFANGPISQRFLHSLPNWI